MALSLFILLPVLAYLIGSIPFGLVFTQFFSSVDIRSAGSRNIGATNVYRTAGPWLGALTLIGDAAKGALPVGVAAGLTEGAPPAFFVALVAAAAFAGHLFPVYSRFRGGGKGVATAAGCFFVISPAAGVVALLTFILFFCLTDRVSVASLAAAAVLPVAVWKATESLPPAVCAAAVGVAIFVRHHENIRRLIAGSEPPLR